MQCTQEHTKHQWMDLNSNKLPCYVFSCVVSLWCGSDLTLLGVCKSHTLVQGNTVSYNDRRADICIIMYTYMQVYVYV